MTAPRPARAERRRPTGGPGDQRDTLRHLAETDGGLAGRASGTTRIERHGLDERTAALTRLAALVALRAAPASYRCGVDVALAAGATVDEVVATLKVVAHTVGLARVVSAAPELAVGLGYDIDRALETVDAPRTNDIGKAVRAGIRSRR